jgi:hypothetical protein
MYIGDSVLLTVANTSSWNCQKLAAEQSLQSLMVQTKEKAWVYHGYHGYQAMPSLCDIAHDGWLCRLHLLYNSSWKFLQLVAWQPLSGQPVRYGKGRRYGPSIAVQNYACRVTILQPAMRAAVLGQPSSLICSNLSATVEITPSPKFCRIECFSILNL